MISSDPRHPILLNITDSALVLVRCAMLQTAVSGQSSGALAMTCLTDLKNWAEELGVPVLATSMTDFRSTVVSADQQGFRSKPPDETFAANPWDDEYFVDAVKATDRTKLVVGGFWTETAVSLTVLCALEQGFDVYVLQDGVCGIELQSHRAALQRMRECGAVSTSCIQTLAEWSHESAPGMLKEKLSS